MEQNANEISTGPLAGRWRELIGPGVVVIVFATLLAWTWGRWLDPILDFGRELYIPWQISQGKHLYTDIAAFYGPLSQHFNGLLFYLFGASLRTLVIANICILAVTTALIYAIVRMVSSRLAAGVATVMFVTIFGIAHLGTTGNFNFITPYSHEATHGFGASVAGLFCFLRFVRSGRRRWMVGIGLCLGLAFLTKPEIFVALAGAMAVGVAAILVSRRKTLHAAAAILALAGGAAIPIVAAVGYLATYMPIAGAVRATLGSWLFMSNRALLENDFYANSMGLDGALSGRLEFVAGIVGRFLALLVPALLLALWLPGTMRGRRALGIGIGLGMTVLVALAEGAGWWKFVSQMLLAMILLAAAFQAFEFFRNRANTAKRETMIVRLTLLAFSILILLKMLLNARFYQYGFFLAAMPTVVLAVALLDWLPAYVQERSAQGWTFRGPALAVLAALTFVQVKVSTDDYAAIRSPVASGSDAFLADDRGPALDDTVRFIRQNTRPGQTLTVLPEGVLLNVLTQRRTPIPYLSMIPPDFAMFGGDKLLASLEKNPPDYIAFLYRPTKEFGKTRFGPDYAQAVFQWMNEHYSIVYRDGPVPFGSDQFGIRLLRRHLGGSGAARE